MTLGQDLKARRLAAGYSQEEVAELLLVSRQTVINWEKDRHLPDVENISRLAELYQLSMDELYGQREKQSQSLTKSSHLKHYLILLGILLLGSVVSFQGINLMLVLLLVQLLRYIWSEIYHHII